MSPDFSMVDSAQKAEELYAQGQLERMLLLPAEFGGVDIEQNVVYVPVGFTAAKAEIDNNVISPLIQEGKVQAYSAVPEYEGASFVPIAIQISAWHPDSPETSTVAGTLAAWGSAVERG
ncbi:hypothetical protein [Mycolicibacterium peregrinum]|nr:hypothetical protein [Mycolicibacterium peregrinum]